MASSKAVASNALLFLSLNLLLFSPMVKSISPSPIASPPLPATCPIDTLKFGVCADLLGPLLNIHIGSPPTTPCCSLINGLADLEAAVCLCAAINANVLGIINVDIDIALSLLLNACGQAMPSGFKCA